MYVSSYVLALNVAKVFVAINHVHAVNAFSFPSCRAPSLPMWPQFFEKYGGLIEVDYCLMPIYGTSKILGTDNSSSH